MAGLASSFSWPSDYYRQKQAAEQAETAAAELANAGSPAALQSCGGVRGKEIVPKLARLAEVEARAGRIRKPARLSNTPGAISQSSND